MSLKICLIRLLLKLSPQIKRRKPYKTIHDLLIFSIVGLNHIVQCGENTTQERTTHGRRNVMPVHLFPILLQRVKTRD